MSSTLVGNTFDFCSDPVLLILLEVSLKEEDIKGKT